MVTPLTEVLEAATKRDPELEFKGWHSRSSLRARGDAVFAARRSRRRDDA